MNETTTNSSVRTGGRIDSLDVLRGVAVLGMLVMNVQAYQIGNAYWNPVSHGDLTGANYAIWLSTFLLANSKFMSIFAMMFGAGVVLMTGRIEARGDHTGDLHLRRMSWLLVIGLLHAYLGRRGDVLCFYAVGGVVAYMFRRLNPRPLIVLGLVVLLVSMAGFVGLGYNAQADQEDAWPEYVDAWTPCDEYVVEQREAGQRGWVDQLVYRAPLVYSDHTEDGPLVTLWCFGLMLVGMALMKLDWFSARRPTRDYVAVMIAAGVIGGAGSLWYVQQGFASGWDAAVSSWWTLGFQLNDLSCAIFSLAWVSLVMLACKSPAWRRLTRPIAAVGRTALTNYLAMTVVLTAIFHGHGLGLLDKVDRTGMVPIVLAMWCGHLVISSLWLRVFRFGPVEWVWRCLTYAKWQPLRRARTGSKT